jgi:hypothetical protein
VTCGDGVISGASVVGGKMATMKRAERERRDAQVLQLFLAGESYRSIAETVGLGSKSTVGQIVERELGSTGDKRELLSDEARSVWLERLEQVWRANWSKASKGDRDAITECRRLLGQWVSVFGLSRPVTLADTGRLEVDAEPERDDDNDPMDELARLRFNRANNLPPSARQEFAAERTRFDAG